LGNGRLGSVARYCDGPARYHELPQINGYPFHPSEQDMISAADIKDQEFPKTSIKPVYWNGTHPSVFEFRVEKESGPRCGGRSATPAGQGPQIQTEVLPKPAFAASTPIEQQCRRFAAPELAS